MPKTIKANESIDFHFQFNLIIAFVVFLISLFLRFRAQKYVENNLWLKASRIIIIGIIAIVILAQIFYFYIEIFK